MMRLTLKEAPYLRGLGAIRASDPLCSFSVSFKSWFATRQGGSVLGTKFVRRSEPLGRVTSLFLCSQY